MKYIKTFDDRDIDYKYLNYDDQKKLKEFAYPLIDDVVENFKKEASIHKFSNAYFSYTVVFDNMFGASFFREIQKFRSKELNCTQPELSNSLGIIFTDYYKDKNIKGLLNDILVEVFEKNTEIYEYNYRHYKDNINKYVKNKCKWILEGDKFNL